MSALGIVAVSVGGALTAFYVTVRMYSRLLRAGELRGWDQSGVFMLAVLMGVIWPLALLYHLAARPSRQERKERKRASALRALKQVERELAAEQRKTRELTADGDDY